MIFRVDDNNRVVEILERTSVKMRDKDGTEFDAPAYHPDFMRNVRTANQARVGQIFDELSGECRDEIPPAIDPALARLMRMTAIEGEFIRAMLMNDLALQNDLRREYTELAEQSSPAK